MKRFLHDKGGAAEEFSVDCFKKAACSTSTVLEEIPSHLDRDIGIFAAHNVTCGPLIATVLRGTKWSVPDYPKASETFSIVKGLNREDDARVQSII